MAGSMEKVPLDSKLVNRPALRLVKVSRMSSAALLLMPGGASKKSSKSAMLGGGFVVGISAGAGIVRGGGIGLAEVGDRETGAERSAIIGCDQHGGTGQRIGSPIGREVAGDFDEVGFGDITGGVHGVGLDGVSPAENGQRDGPVIGAISHDPAVGIESHAHGGDA